MRPRLLVVRSGERSFPSELVPELDVVERTTHSIETLHPDAAIMDGRFDFAIVTSRAAVDRLLARDDLLSRLSGRVVAVGPATAERLRSALAVEVEEGGGSARRLLRTLPRNLSGARVLLLRGEDAGKELPRQLTARGAEVVPLTLYLKRRLPYDSALDLAIVDPAPAVFCATSPAAARWLFEGASGDARARLRDSPGIALGESTAEALSERGVARIEVARPPTFERVARIAVSLAARAPEA